MAVSINEDLMTITAAVNVAVTDYGKVIAFSGEWPTLASASIRRLAGLVRSAANSGESLSVAYRGIGKAQFGAAVNTVGYSIGVLAAASSGWLAGGNAAAYAIHGRALSTCASGDMAMAMFNFSYAGKSF